MIISQEQMNAAARDADRQAQYHTLIAQRRRARTTDDSPNPKAAESNMTNMTYNEPTSNSPTAPDRDQLVSEFNHDPALQREFLTLENYVAYRAAEAAGRFKLLRKV